jgi:hypothetical protein
MPRWIPRGRLDAHVEAAVRQLADSDPHYTVEEVLRVVRGGIPGSGLRGLNGPITAAQRVTQGWPVEEALVAYAKGRIRAYLHQTRTAVTTNGLRVEVRIFEQYRDDQGRYRWQSMRDMTADEVAADIYQRRLRMAGEEARIEVLESVLAELRRHPDGTTVGQIEDRIFADGSAVDVSDPPSRSRGGSSSRSGYLA